MFLLTKGRALSAVLLGLALVGTAVLGLMMMDRSALPAWIPRSVIQALPDRLILPDWVPTSWAEAKARFGLASAGTLPPVSTAELKDHVFELVPDEVKQGEATVDVRLVNKRSGTSVPDAVVFARRIDMAPDGMPTMTAPIEPMPSPEPGIYRFKTNLAMEGGWQLSLAAKVQGEVGTVQNRLVLKAVP
ncbi:FixH family protein [Microvirga splendida]